MAGWAGTRTAWHPLLVLLIEQLLPRERWQTVPEFQLSREPRRVDVVLLRREGGAEDDDEAPRLRSLLSHLRPHTLVHFKGPTSSLEREDALMLYAYALQYLVLAEVERPETVALRVLAPSITPRFRRALSALGCELSPSSAGVSEGELGPFALRVVEAEPASREPGERPLYTLSPALLRDPRGVGMLDELELQLFQRLTQHVEQLRPDEDVMTIKDTQLIKQSYSESLRKMMELIPMEERLAGVPVEERLAGVPVEERLAGVPVEERLLAMPVEALRALSEAYLATLPEGVRAEILSRRAR